MLSVRSATEHRAAASPAAGLGWLADQAATRPSKIRISARWSRTCDAGSVGPSWLMTLIRTCCDAFAALSPNCDPADVCRLTGLSSLANFQAAYAEQLRRVAERLAD
jgi:hypothetical protein